MPQRPLIAVAIGLLAILMLCVASVSRADGREVRIGVLAKRGPDQALQHWWPTADYLSEKVPGHHFIIVPLGFDEIFPAVEKHRVDFVLANPVFYVELESRYGVSRIATLRNDNQGHAYRQFGGVIFTRADRKDIQTLEDIKGKTFAAVDPTSLGGFLAAWRRLDAIGLDPRRDFAKLSYLGTHDAVVEAVLHGTVDVGTVRTDTLERMEDEGRIKRAQFKVLGAVHHPDFPFLCSTALYPEWPFARVSGTSDNLSHQVAAALLAMPETSDAARSSRTLGWTVPGNYQPVHELMKTLRIGPYRDLGKISLLDVLRLYWYWFALGGLVLLLLALFTAHVARLNARLRLSQRALREARDTLEQRVVERTTDLRQALEAVRESRGRETQARREWNAAFDAIQDPIFIHDDGLKLVHANRAYLARAGLDEEAIRGRPYWEVFPRLEAPMATCTDHHAHDGARVEELALDDGSVYLSHAYRMGEEQEHVVHILQDVSARRQAEAALQDARELFQVIFDSASDGITVIEPESLQIVMCNPAACQMLGYTLDEIKALTLTEIHPPEQREETLRRVRIQAEQSRAQEADVPVLRKDGSIFYANIHKSRIVLDGKPYVMSEIRDISQRLEVEAERRRGNERLQRSLVQTIEAIAITIEKRDPYTSGHQHRVQALALAIGRELGFDESRLEGLGLGALIHDIGKIYVPSEVLNRPGKLSEVEFRLVQTHPQVGYEIVKGVEFPWPMAQTIYQHHERYDGTGYPQGLKGEEILLEARIVAVADVVEAMSSHRPFRPALGIDAALEEIRTHRGTLYDPQVVDACVALFTEGRFAWEAEVEA